MQISNDYYLIVDVEATCSNNGLVPRAEMEIIEIGAVMMDSHTFEIASEFQAFIKPVRHPELTAFCTELTGITQDKVENAPPFADSIDAMQNWMRGFDDSLFCSWGDYDRNQFMQDCAYHHIDYPFGTGHMNLKAEFSCSLGLKKRLGVSEALKYFNLKFEGSHHRGLDDAKNMARVVRRLLMG